MHDPLAPLLAEGVIDEVVARLKSGKEAELWLVRHGAEVVAAKVYKARQTRSFKNDAAYKEGRQVRNTRTQRAMDRGSRFGREAAEDAWKTKEADALHALHAAGVHVPRPVLFYEGVLLMELVVDAAGRPAPRLVDAPVGREQAAAFYADLRSQAVRMLCCDLIHGDLSPYNVLAGRDGLVIIDFPQVVGAAHNSQAERFFLRDLDNVRRHLEGLDPALRSRAGDGPEIWRAYVRRELTPEFVPSGRLAEPRHPPLPGARSHHGAPHGAPRSQRPGQQHQEHPRQPQQPPHQPQPQHQHQPNPRQAQQPQGRGPRSPDQSGAREARPTPPPRPPRPQGPPRDQGRRPSERVSGRGSPLPVVVRVQRPPLGSSHQPGQPGAPGSAAGPPSGAPPPPRPHHGEPSQPPAGGHRRRRRRRR